MPKKIKFKVLRASGEDEKYKASELDSHGPSVRGWLSSRNCSYPQEILFSLSSPAVIHQIQILAHHYIIPERIDVWIGSDNDASLQKEDDDIQFEYIGFITLSNNENTKFKCRELKTISIPSVEPTKYVKLTLYQNHPNNLNAYNQVGLVAIQIMGEELSENENNLKNSKNVGESSCFDDLAFEMYVDQEVAAILKQLEEKKKKAVLDERFEYARKLKSAMAKLRLAGEKLGKMETAKKQAIQQEDYSKAKKKKLQIEEFKSQIYSNLNIDDLLEKNGVVPSNDEELDPQNEDVNRILFKNDNETHLNVGNREVDSKIIKNSPSATHIPGEPTILTNTFGNDLLPGVYESPVSPLHLASTTIGVSSEAIAPPKQPSSKTGSLRRKNKALGSNRNSYESGDETSTSTFRPFCHSESKEPTPNNLLSQILLQSKLNEREKKQAVLSVNVFGKNLVEKIFSKQYSDKEEALKLVEAALKSFIAKEKENKLPSKTHSSSKITRASTYLLHRCLRDKVFAVYSAATEVIRFFFTEFVTDRVPPSEITRSVELILPDLLSKAGDTTPRVHNLAVHTILSLADAPQVRKLNIIPSHLTRILTANIHARLAQSRLEMVEQLILNHGISSDKQSGMTCRILAEFGLSGLHHPAEAVRKMAEKILVLVYHFNPRLVRRQLPPDDDVTRRNILYRHLMQEFDRVDIEKKNLSRSDISDKEIVSKYSSCFGKTLHKAKSEQKLKRCIFCHLESDLLNEKELNIHYWKYCPMLMRCTNCNQVIEISALNEHLTSECDMKAMYRKCQVCSQAVGIEDLNNHHTSVRCTLMAMKKACPLCFAELEDGENELRIHLTGMGSAVCAKHPRAKYLVNNISCKRNNH